MKKTETTTPTNPTAPSLQLNLRQKRKRIRRILKIEEKTKALYKEKDALTAELLATMPPGEKVAVDGTDYAIKDNFEAKNQVWSGACVRRFELDEVKPLPAKPVRKTAAAAVEEEVLP